MVGFGPIQLFLEGKMPKIYPKQWMCLGKDQELVQVLYWKLLPQFMKTKKDPGLFSNFHLGFYAP